MEVRGRTLVVLLSMHRCGSSLTTQVLERLGMSLGPFDLIGAEPTNPYGHFEAVPFHALNRRVQRLVFGFPDDLPDSPEVLERFLSSKGRWAPESYVPEEFLSEGRSLIRTLVDSGEVSGFKDPRTVLTWPFWDRVLESFPDLRVVPLGLIRSPHEIAMSLVTRRDGWLGYWTSLDVIAVHFLRQREILESGQDRIPSLCFGSPAYLSGLEFAVKNVGLTWSTEIVIAQFDHSAVHQRPAAVHHAAQELFEAMCGDVTTDTGADINAAQLVKDARSLERLRIDQWNASKCKALESRHEAENITRRLSELETDLREARNRANEIDRARAEAERARGEVSLQLIAAQARELEAWREMSRLRDRLARFEEHPVLGVALRGRRQLRRLIHSIGETAPAVRNGHH